MSVRSVHQGAGVADMTNYGDHAPVKVDTDDDKLKFKDNDGNVRKMVSEDQTQTLTNKTLAAPVVSSSPTGDGVTQWAEVAVSSAELLALRATPKTLVAAPGAGKMLEFVAAVILADNGTAYVVGTNDAAIRHNNTTGDIVSETIDSAGLLDQTTDIVTVVQALATDTKSPKADVENTPLVLHNTGAAEWTTGTGTVRVKISYRVWTTGW